MDALKNRPSREAALAWVRGHCPDLEIQNGPDWCRAHFTWKGREHIVDTSGPQAREEVALRLWELLRAEQGSPVPGAGGEADEGAMIREIMRARVAGQDPEADKLELALVARRMTRPVPPLHRGAWAQPSVRSRGDLPPSPRQETYLNRDRKVY